MCRNDYIWHSCMEHVFCIDAVSDLDSGRHRSHYNDHQQWFVIYWSSSRRIDGFWSLNIRTFHARWRPNHIPFIQNHQSGPFIVNTIGMRHTIQSKWLYSRYTVCCVLLWLSTYPFSQYISYGYPSAGALTLRNIGEYMMWIHCQMAT